MSPIQECPPTGAEPSVKTYNISEYGFASPALDTYDYTQDVLMIGATQTGQDIWCKNVANSTGFAYTGLGYDDAVGGAPGMARVIGCGFEVTNTTADLYKQGSVVVYRKEWDKADANIRVAATSYANTLVKAYSGLPRTLSEAYRLPGSRQWAAEEGCYVTGTFEDLHCPMVGFAPTPVMVGNYPISYSLAGGVGPGYRNYMIDGSVPIDGSTHIMHQTGLALSGAYFSGLSLQTTLQVTLKVFLEIQPCTIDPFIDFATPSADYDPVVLELYSRTVSTMPAGVPKGDNDGGDFFRGILKVVSAVAPTIGTVMSFIPELAPIGAGVKIAGAMAGKGLQVMSNTKKADRSVKFGNEMASYVPKVASAISAYRAPPPKVPEKGAKVKTVPVKKKP